MPRWYWAKPFIELNFKKPFGKILSIKTWAATINEDVYPWVFKLDCGRKAHQFNKNFILAFDIFFKTSLKNIEFEEISVRTLKNTTFAVIAFTETKLTMQINYEIQVSKSQK